MQYKNNIYLWTFIFSKALRITLINLHLFQPVHKSLSLAALFIDLEVILVLFHPLILKHPSLEQHCQVAYKIIYQYIPLS